jgi:7-cyano-7-deazaguanine synthase in queuosine biosynthesis
MCQIIALRTISKTIKKFNTDSLYHSDLITGIESSLNEKGGDYLAATALVSGETIRLPGKNIREMLYHVSTICKDFPDTYPVDLLFFSRQQPEMESSFVEEQPYISDNFMIAVHGTIYNDQELAKEHHAKIGADTEIFKFMNIAEWYKAKGTFSIIGFDIETGSVISYNNGLDIYEKTLIDFDEDPVGTFISTDPMHWVPRPTFIKTGFEYPYKDDVLQVAFSGGMDIALSVYKSVSIKKYKTVNLNYFAWGSKAEEMEISQLDKFIDFYSLQPEFKDIVFNKCIIPAEGYFKEYFNINGAHPPKIYKESSSVADKNETESPLAYVPYRNTQFAILLASLSEASNLYGVDILFGLNLSEGMVFMDNSQGWLETINKTITLGAKDFEQSSTFKVISPYFARTKTNMISEFAAEFGKDTLSGLLEISRSCYYPDENGNACGSCGSCILRAKALSNLKD